MSQFSIGEDILGVLMIVGLFSLFFIVWSDSYLSHQEQELSRKKSKILLSISDYLRNGSLSENAEPALINKKILENEISSLLTNLEHEGIGLEVEIITQDGETVHSSGRRLESPVRSVSLPIIYENRNGRTTAFLNIRMEI